MARKDRPTVHVDGRNVRIGPPGTLYERKWPEDHEYITLTRREALDLSQQLASAAHMARDPKKVRAGERGGEVRRAKSKKRKQAELLQQIAAMPPEQAEVMLKAAIEAGLLPKGNPMSFPPLYVGGEWVDIQEQREKAEQKKKAKPPKKNARDILRRAMRGT